MSWNYLDFYTILSDKYFLLALIPAVSTSRGSKACAVSFICTSVKEILGLLRIDLQEKMLFKVLSEIIKTHDLGKEIRGNKYQKNQMIKGKIIEKNKLIFVLEGP